MTLKSLLGVASLFLALIFDGVVLAEVNAAIPSTGGHAGRRRVCGDFGRDGRRILRDQNRPGKGLHAPNTAGFQKVWRQSLETFITTYSYLLTRGTDTGTRIGSEDFVSGLAALSLRSER